MRQVKIGLILLLVVMATTHTFANTQTMDLDFKDTDIRDVLRILSLQHNVNIHADPEVKGAVTLRLTNVTLEEALTSLLRSYGFTYTKENNVYYVTKPPAARPYTITYGDERITIDAKDADIRELLREIALSTGVNIVPEPQVSGRVSILLKALPLEEALATLLETQGCQYTKEGNIYRVKKLDNLAKVTFSENLLSLEVRNQEIQQVLNQIARVTGQNIIPDRDVTGNVSGTFTALPLEKGLAAFLEANGFRLDLHENIYRVRRRQLTPTPDFAISLDQDGRFSIDLTNAESTQVFRELARRAGVNLVIFNQVKTMINSIQLRNVSLEEAFAYLLKGTNFTFVKTANTYIIGDGSGTRVDSLDLIYIQSFPLRHINAATVPSLLPAYLPAQNIRVLKEQNTLVISGTPTLLEKFSEYLQTIDVVNTEIIRETIPIQHLKAEDLVKLLPETYRQMELIVHQEQNTLVANGLQSQIEELKAYIAKIDLPQPQILFDVLIVEVLNRQEYKAGFDTSLGFGHTNLNFGGTQAGISYDIVNITPKFAVSLQTLLDQGKARVRANPRLITLSGKEASFNVVTQMRYREPRYNEEGNEILGVVRTLDTGIKLNLKPLVTGSGEIIIEVKPDISEVLDTSSELPITSDRAVHTTLRVRDGQTIIIGGMIQTTKDTSEKRIPILSDIPLLGSLFRYRSTKENESEFVIYITPQLITDAQQTIDALEKQGVDPWLTENLKERE